MLDGAGGSSPRKCQEAAGPAPTDKHGHHGLTWAPASGSRARTQCRPLGTGHCVYRRARSLSQGQGGRRNSDPWLAPGRPLTEGRKGGREAEADLALRPWCSVAAAQHPSSGPRPGRGRSTQAWQGLTAPRRCRTKSLRPQQAAVGGPAQQPAVTPAPRLESRTRAPLTTAPLVSPNLPPPPQLVSSTNEPLGRARGWG